MSGFVGSMTALSFALLFMSACAAPQPSTDTANAPRDAQERGWVHLTFDIDPTGSPKNINVVKSSHGGKFDSRALAALASFKYKPTIVDGKATWLRDQEVLIRYEDVPPNE